MKEKGLFVFALILHIVLLILLPYIAWPEMLVRPYLMLHGWLPYKDIIMEHNPLLLVDLTIFYKLFGIGLLQLKIYTWIWILLTDAILFFVVKKLWNFRYAAFALLFYIPIQVVYEGNALWFDFALAPLALLIFYSLKKRDYFWSGIFLGIAFFIKQTAFWFVFPILLYFYRDLRKKSFEKLLSFTKGTLIVFTLSLIVIAAFGILPYFIQWTVKYGVFYLPQAKDVASFPTIKRFLAAIFPFTIVFPLLFIKKGKDKDLIFWSFFSGLGVFPRFALFHFQPSLPFLAIGTGIVINNLLKSKKRLFKFVFLGFSIILLFIYGKFVKPNWGKETRFFGQSEINIASYVSANIEPGEEIYVLNYWDSIYAMTNTIPATKPLVPFLSWYLEYDGVEDGIVGDLLVDLPELIVAGNYTSSGLGSYRLNGIDMILDKYYTLTFGKDGILIYQINR